MGLYSKYLFPLFMDWSLGSAVVAQHRGKALSEARGEVLEIGFGTGLNLSHYPDVVTKLFVLDVENVGLARIRERIARSKIPIEQFNLDASNRLPFADNQFDSVVSTFTLCSIRDLTPALAEIRRVLKSDGSYLFFEHGRSDDPATARKQDRFNPIQKVIGAGCNINRPIDKLVSDSGMNIIVMDRFRLADVPRMMGEMYRGIAVPNK